RASSPAGQSAPAARRALTTEVTMMTLTLTRERQVCCEARCAGVGRPLPLRGRLAAPLVQGDGVARLVVTDAVEVVAHQQQAAPAGPRQPRLVERVGNGVGVEALPLVLDLGPDLLGRHPVADAHPPARVPPVSP